MRCMSIVTFTGYGRPDIDCIDKKEAAPRRRFFFISVYDREID
jgi:hypothetical protein